MEANKTRKVVLCLLGTALLSSYIFIQTETHLPNEADRAHQKTANVQSKGNEQDQKFR